MIQVQILIGDLHKDYLGSPEVINSFFANNVRLKGARDVGMVSLCLSCHDASNYMQHNYFCHHAGFTWAEVNVGLTFQDPRACFSPRLKKRNTSRPNYVAGFISSKVIWERIHTYQERLFWPSYLGRLIYWRFFKRTCIQISDALENYQLLFRFQSRYHGAKIEGRFRKILLIG